MKKLYSLSKFYPFICLSAMMLIIVSCSKPDNTKTFDDIFDVSGIENLNRSIDKASSVSELSQLFEDVDLNITESITAEKIEQIYTTLEKNIQLSQDEIDKLLMNDPETLLDVLSRFGNMPQELSDKYMDFSELENSPLNSYLLMQREKPGITYYPDDFYGAVQTYRKYVENCIIKPLRKFHFVILLHDESQLPPGAKLEYYVLITMNNNWDMWWSYWSWGWYMFKIKHKGGHGSFPG